METVALSLCIPTYNESPPFHPDRRYPEARFPQTSTTPNRPYASFRQVLFDLGYDRVNFGTDRWNPLGAIVKPGQTVVIKPNFVLSFHSRGHDIFSVITHPSILRAVVDYTYLALSGRGQIIIADAPQMDCNWASLMDFQRLQAIQDFYRAELDFEIKVRDLRNFAILDHKRPPFTENRGALEGDPLGSVTVNLGKTSHFYGLPNQNFYGADFDRQETIRHHRAETHEYMISKTILSADVFISVPKMKTHKKVGVTLNLKGLVGINTNKNCLVHYRVGTPVNGGDQLPATHARKDRLLVKTHRWLSDNLLAKKSTKADKIYRVVVAAYRRTLKPFYSLSNSTTLVDAGNWHGNDSAWRMTADLAKIIFFADASGKLHDTPQRRFFCVVDGIIGGEGPGPLEPIPKPSGCLLAGQHPFAVDIITTRLMGFDPSRIRQFDVLSDQRWDFGLKGPDEITAILSGQSVPGAEFCQSPGKHFAFAPHPGWIGRIETK